MYPTELNIEGRLKNNFQTTSCFDFNTLMASQGWFLYIRTKIYFLINYIES